MATAEDRIDEALDIVSVIRWRREKLIAVGYTFAEAKILAKRVDVDLHLACELVCQGCPTACACEILL